MTSSILLTPGNWLTGLNSLTKEKWEHVLMPFCKSMVEPCSQYNLTEYCDDCKRFIVAHMRHHTVDAPKLMWDELQTPNPFSRFPGRDPY